MPKYDVSNSLGRGVDVSSLGFDTLHNPNASVLYDTTDSTYIYYQVVGDALLTTYAFEYTPLSNGNALVTSILVGSDSELISVVSGLAIEMTPSDIVDHHGFYLATSFDDEFFLTDFADWVDAGSGNDVIVTYLDNDVVNAGTGNDWINPGGGNDHVDGGPGIDTVYMAGNFDEYVYFTDGLGTYSIEGFGEIDTITSVEYVEFGDGTITSVGKLIPPAIYTITGGAQVSEGGVLTFTIQRTDSFPEETVLLTLSGTALAGSDYAAIQTVEFALGENTKTLTLQTHGDTLVEGSESVSVTLTGATSPYGSILPKQGATGVILDATVSPPPLAVTITGTPGADILVGNALDNTIIGLAGNDQIHGLAGNDKLLGGRGKDILYGNGGKDSFVFDTKPNNLTNVDRIMDFRSVDDTVKIDNAVFTKVGPNGRLKADAFTVGKAAHDAEDRIIYNRATGTLYYDPDGTGSAAQIKFAVLANKATLSVSDLVVI